MYNVIIERETSHYNKYMLWKATGKAIETKASFSMYYKTLKQAIEDNKKYNIILIKK